MYHWTEEDIVHARSIAEGAGAGLVYARDFVPEGCDSEACVSVLYRAFTPAELAIHIDTPSGLIGDKNTAQRIVLSIEGEWGAKIPAKVAWLADLFDVALTQILADAGAHLGLYEADAIESVMLKPTLMAEHLEPFSLDAPTLAALLAKYRDPGQLRAVVAGEAPPLVLRRPKADEMQLLSGKGLHAASTDLLLACIAHPAPIEQRRAIIERWPGLSASLLPLLASMRNAAGAREKKGKRTYGAALGT